jgi:hypothetical protein
MNACGGAFGGKALAGSGCGNGDADRLFIGRAFQKVDPSHDVVAIHVSWSLSIVDENEFGQRVLRAQQGHDSASASGSTIDAD